MKKNFFKGAAIAAMAFAGLTATAQEESKGIELSGSVDAYFRANINGKNGSQSVAPSTSFANADGFALGMANLIASKKVGKVGFVADLVFGPRGAAAVDGEGSTNIVNQLFVTYDASDAVTLTFGNFNTFLGYEVISPTGNFNYSTSYMFSNGPFSHTGLKADFALDDNWSLMAAIMNQTDNTFTNLNGKYTGGLQLGYSADSGSAYLNFTYGRNSASADDINKEAGALVINPEENAAISAEENTFQVDLTTGWDLTDDFYLGFNGTYQDTDGSGFYGVALYPQYAFSDTFSLGGRGEYFTLFADGGEDDSVFAATLTGSITQGNLTIKPEIRADFDNTPSGLNTFVDGDGENSDNLFSFVVGAIYSF